VRVTIGGGLCSTPCHSDSKNPRGTGTDEHLGASVQGRPRGCHVIDEQEASRLRETLPEFKGPLEIRKAPVTFQTGLRNRRPRATEQVKHRHTKAGCKSSGKKSGLVEPPLPQAPGMQRNGDDAIERNPRKPRVLQGREHQFPQYRRQGSVGAVLETMKKIPNGTIMAVCRNQGRKVPSSVSAIGAGKGTFKLTGTHRADLSTHRKEQAPAR